MDKQTYEETRNGFIGQLIALVMMYCLSRTEGLPEKRELFIKALSHPGFSQKYQFQLAEYIDSIVQGIDQSFLLKASGVGIRNDETASRVVAGLKK